MKRSFGVLAIMAAATATASAGEVQFFLSSPAAINGAIDGTTALALMQNPVINTAVAGSAQLQLWMYLDAAQMQAGTGAGNTYGTFGGGLDIIGSGSHTVPLVVNPTGPRWPTAVNAAPGADYLGMQFLTSNPVTPATAPDGQPGLFLIATGDISWTAGEVGSANIALPGGGAIGSNSALFTAVGGFGFTALGGAYDDTPPNPDVDPGTGTGWILADASGTGTVSVIPDLFLVPEPASMTLLAVGALILRRRR